MDTLSYSTPAKRRDPQPITVDWCGETLTIRRPKDSVLYFASVVTATDVSEPDRAAAMFDFLNGTLEPDQRKRFFTRVLNRDDPINAATTIALIGHLFDTWHNWPGQPPDTIVIEEQPGTALGDSVQVEHPDLDLDVNAHPPKDIVLFFVASSLATTATVGQQAWSIGLFLDASLDAADSLLISQRLRDRNDDLDLHHISEIVGDLIARWSPQTNRAQRRAAARAGQ